MQIIQNKLHWIFMLIFKTVTCYWRSRTFVHVVKYRALVSVLSSVETRVNISLALRQIKSNLSIFELLLLYITIRVNHTLEFLVSQTFCLSVCSFPFSPNFLSILFPNFFFFSMSICWALTQGITYYPIVFLVFKEFIACQ